MKNAIKILTSYPFLLVLQVDEDKSQEYTTPAPIRKLFN